MFGALVLFESRDAVHVVAISFTALVLTELLMVALTVQDLALAHGRGPATQPRLLRGFARFPQ